MSAPKKSVRARRAKPAPATRPPELSNVLHDLREVTAYLETAYKGVARDYYCREVDMLEAGIWDLNSVLIQLERIEVRFASFRRSDGMSQGGSS
jgi:hypothetical protein